MKLTLLLTILAFSSVFLMTNAISLPYEVKETLLDLMSTKDISKINTKGKRSIVPIYRKDLDPKYIAYYEISHRKQFVVLSAGPNTKDHRKVESGPSPSPTKVLINQARKVGQRCLKFYRLSTMGLYMCENKRGVAVAASFDWTLDAPVNDWKKLQGMVKESLEDFKKAWQRVAASLKEEWKTSQRKKVNQKPGIRAYDAEIVAPGSTAKVALEKNHRDISIHAIPEKRQQELCAILVDVCKNKGIKVNPKRIHTTKNYIKYLQFQVNDDKDAVRKVLLNKEISFYFKIVTQDREQLLKYFSVDLSSHRTRRWSSWSRWSVKKEYLFPDYNQHKCCGCYSGCGPVAWAQILGYYDRLAYYSPSSGFSNRFWTCRDASRRSSSGRCVAPRTMSSNVKKYIEGIRKKLGSFCFFGGGATKPGQMRKIIDWYRARGIGGRVFSHYHTFSWTGWTKKWIRSRAANHVKAGYPAIIGIWVKGKKNKAMHYAVATRYAQRSKKYRSCFLFWCKTKTKWQQSFYLHMGWGGHGNGWYSLHAYAAFCARKY